MARAVNSGGVTRFTVLYDAGCGLCRSARRWLEGRAQLVPLEFLAAGSPTARRRFPDLDHDGSLEELTVVTDTGDVYVGDGAWLACLWALDAYRALADTLAKPHLMPLARGVIKAASAVRERTGDSGYRNRDDGEACAH